MVCSKSRLNDDKTYNLYQSVDKMALVNIN